jgi:hypothetical protein
VDGTLAGSAALLSGLGLVIADVEPDPLRRLGVPIESADEVIGGAQVLHDADR